MRTRHNTPTRSKLARHNGRAGNDTKPLFTYEAELLWTQHNRAMAKIKARSLEEARRKANELSSEDIEDWDPTAGDMWVDSVQLADGGSDDE